MVLDLKAKNEKREARLKAKKEARLGEAMPEAEEAPTAADTK